MDEALDQVRGAVGTQGCTGRAAERETKKYFLWLMGTRENARKELLQTASPESSLLFVEPVHKVRRLEFFFLELGVK